MVDAPAVVLAHLNNQAPLTALTGTRIWAETETPPPGYTPADGAAICFSTRGGGLDQEDAVVIPSVQFKVYAGTAYAAGQAYRALFDALHGGRGEGLLHGNLEAPGQALLEPDTLWPYVLCFFEIMVFNEA